MRKALKVALLGTDFKVQIRLENLQKQTVQLKTAIQEKEIEIEGLKEDIENWKSQDEYHKEKINA